jgi:septum formation protein
MTALILASASASRANLLRNAGLQFEAIRPTVDEEAVKQSLRAEGIKPRDQADALAEVKALSISSRRPGLVIGADQMLAVDDTVLDKPADREEAKSHLRKLSGKTHSLLTAVVVARDGEPLWRHIDTPRLTMRSLNEVAIDAYLDAVGPAAFTSVGAYQLEGRGAQLFTRVDGDFFSVLGLPLLPLLGFLRQHGVVDA